MISCDRKPILGVYSGSPNFIWFTHFNKPDPDRLFRDQGLASVQRSAKRADWTKPIFPPCRISTAMIRGLGNALIVAMIASLLDEYFYAGAPH
jgi:hypothetical protein